MTSQITRLWRHALQRNVTNIRHEIYTPLYFYSSESGDPAQVMQAMLQSKLDAVHVTVVDISGGCGSMYDIEVASPQFIGQSRVKQHRMVNEILQSEIATMHGLTIRTLTPEQYLARSKGN